MTRVSAGLVAAVILLTACAPGGREAEPFQGRWQSEGFGSFMVIDGDNVDIYEHTEVSCVRVSEGSARGISNVVSLEGEGLVLDEGGRIVRFHSVEALPLRCADDFYTGDPQFTLRVVDATFREHYLPGVDPGWGDRVDAALAALGPDTSASDLADAVIGVLAPLGDPEVRLAATGTLREVWRIGDDDVTAALREQMEHRGAVESGSVVSGEVGGVAYLGILQLEAVDEDAAALTRAIDSALAGVDGPLIVDLRALSGGLESLARVVGSRFVSTERSVGTRLVRIDGAETIIPAGEITVAPLQTGAFSGDLYVLIGPGTTGGGEVLAAALRSVEGAVFVGEPTGGVPGQPLVRVLPTEWSLGVPHQRLELPDGATVGPEGLEPDEELPLTVEDLARRDDPQLERAVERAMSLEP